MIENYKHYRHGVTPPHNHMSPPRKRHNDNLLLNLMSNVEWRNKMLKMKMERLSHNLKKSRSIIVNSKPALMLNYNVHIFYYAWYANSKIDGQYRHWNHMYLENWRKDSRKVYPTGTHAPPHDIGSNYYPSLGCYSSRDTDVINHHMKLLQDAGIGVVGLSWLPSKFVDSPHDILHSFFDIASKYNLKIALHIEPYPGRNPINLQEHLRVFFNIFRNHTALYKMKKPLGKIELPVLYIYDSYLTPAVAWKELLGNKGNLSIRNTEYDAVYIGLLAETQHRYHIKKSQFDGFYTYFAANGFTYGSTWKNWKMLGKFATENGLIFIPSVGPGYIDTQVRPWNSANIRHRRHGQYYEVAWKSAIDNHVQYVSVTSFNEWHEGTQIEPAQPKTEDSFTYLDYEPEGPDFYMNLTKWWITQFKKSFQ
ncbi:hypothetical protein Trydic_g6235 [Trypoxylus dichotomus]